MSIVFTSLKLGFKIMLYLIIANKNHKKRDYYQI